MLTICQCHPWLYLHSQCPVPMSSHQIPLPENLWAGSFTCQLQGASQRNAKIFLRRQMTQEAPILIFSLNCLSLLGILKEGEIWPHNKKSSFKDQNLGLRITFEIKKNNNFKATYLLIYVLTDKFSLGLNPKMLQRLLNHSLPFSGH